AFPCHGLILVLALFACYEQSFLFRFHEAFIARLRDLIQDPIDDLLIGHQGFLIHGTLIPNHPKRSPMVLSPTQYTAPVLPILQSPDVNEAKQRSTDMGYTSPRVKSRNRQHVDYNECQR